jgi:CRISPR/Cas system CSM-associated protein Csm3 (group 7 of RAMP superfamily)
VNGTPQRLNVDYRIAWESDWHAGSGEGSAGIDRLVQRRTCGCGRRLPFVPGAQLKGVLRHQCERLAAVLGCEVVPPHQVGREIAPELLKHFRPLRGSGLLIDRLFGSRFQGECLFVEDALPESEEDWPARAHGRTSIDRLSRTARDRTLFVSEVVAGGGRALRGRIRARHPAGTLSLYDGDFPLEYALLLAGLLTLDSLGGSRSSGLGVCRVDVPDGKVKWNDDRVPVQIALSSFSEKEWSLLLDLAREGGGL